jgi:hypothetical protein
MCLKTLSKRPQNKSRPRCEVRTPGIHVCNSLTTELHNTSGTHAQWLCTVAFVFSITKSAFCPQTAFTFHDVLITTRHSFRKHKSVLVTQGACSSVSIVTIPGLNIRAIWFDSLQGQEIHLSSTLPSTLPPVQLVPRTLCQRVRGLDHSRLQVQLH